MGMRTPGSLGQHGDLVIETYLANGENGTRAWMEIYPNCSADAAKVKAHYFLKQPHVQRTIEKRRAELRAKFRMTTEDVMLELARVARFSHKRLLDDEGRRIPLHKLDEDVAAALADVELEEDIVDGKQVVRIARFRAHSKMTALSELVKVLRLCEVPPLPPEDPDNYDEKEMVKALAFLLEEQAHKAKSQPQLPKTVQGSRVNGKQKALT